MGSRWPEPLLGSSSHSWPLLVAAAAIVVSAIASATSAAIISLGEHRAAALLENRQKGTLRGLRSVAGRPDAVRLALLCLDTVAKLAIGLALAGWLHLFVADQPLVAWLGGVGIALAALVTLTVARAFAAREPERSVLWAAPIGAGADYLLRPLILPLAALARVIRGNGVSAEMGTTEELEYLIEKSARTGVLDEARRDLLSSVIEFSEVRVREIMVPRPKVVGLASEAPYEEVLETVVSSGHSRLPVFRDSVDNVVGVLYAKRLLEDMGRADDAARRAFRLADCLAPPFFVPETMKISHLLAEFQRRGLQIAVVVDEFGGTSGVVTLEDVVEEIVGEIRDENDHEIQEPIRQVGPGVFIAEGEASVREVEDFLEDALDSDFEFPEEGDYETIGGFVTATAGRVPRLGEKVSHDGLVFIVRGADEKRVERVEITVPAGRWQRDDDEANVEEVPEPRRQEVASGIAREGPGNFVARLVSARR